MGVARRSENAHMERNMSTGVPAELTILRRKQVQAHTGYSRSTIYLRITQGLWTRPIPIGSRAVGWPAREVATLNAARIAGRSNDEIRTLVERLEAERQRPLTCLVRARECPP